MSARRNCSDLGVCQGRAPACAGCTPRPFAPGVIERHQRRRQHHALLRWMVRAAALVAITAGAAFLAGLATGSLT